MIFLHEKKRGHKLMHAYKGALSHKDGLFNSRNVNIKQQKDATLCSIFNNYSLKSRLRRIIVLVYTHEVISTKSERKPLKSTI